jgi:hypothetical protein
VKRAVARDGWYPALAGCAEEDIKDYYIPRDRAGDKQRSRLRTGPEVLGSGSLTQFGRAS